MAEFGERVEQLGEGSGFSLIGEESHTAESAMAVGEQYVGTFYVLVLTAWFQV